jgi:UDP-glucose 4-epimerase
VKKVVVIGASGFVGKALNLPFNNEAYEIIGVSRHAAEGQLQIDSYKNCPTGDMLIHLAEESDRNKANHLGDKYFFDSLAMTKDMCERFDGQVIYCSSAVVYGDKNTKASVEGDSVFASDLYSKLKLQNEKIVVDQGGCALRIANLYGTGMSQNNVLSDIIKQIDSSEVMKLKNIYPIRDFLHIYELVTVFHLLINDFHSGIFNVGSGQGTSVGDLAAMVLSLSGQSQREIISGSEKTQDSINFLDTSKITNELGWYPKLTLRENLKNMLTNEV